MGAEAPQPVVGRREQQRRRRHQTLERLRTARMKGWSRMVPGMFASWNWMNFCILKCRPIQSRSRMRQCGAYQSFLFSVFILAKSRPAYLLLWLDLLRFFICLPHSERA